MRQYKLKRDTECAKMHVSSSCRCSYTDIKQTSERGCDQGADGLQARTNCCLLQPIWASLCWPKPSQSHHRAVPLRVQAKCHFKRSRNLGFTEFGITPACYTTSWQGSTSCGGSIAWPFRTCRTAGTNLTERIIDPAFARQTLTRTDSV